MSGYLLEMKEDNETLVKAINNSMAMNPEHGQKGQERGSIKETKEEKQEIQEQNILLEYKAGCRAAAKKQAINAYKIMPEENEANVLPVKVEDWNLHRPLPLKIRGSRLPRNFRTCCRLR